jgi:two-component system cell cycle sensor histidine kinase/response regulator CckA
MSELGAQRNLRVLVIDDNRAIHDDFRKILCSTQRHGKTLEDAETLLFDSPAPNAGAKRLTFEIDSAYQGKEGLALVQQAAASGRPYAMAFVDVRMPPGWDGVETTARIWEVCPDLQIVICTAYSDYSWDEMSAKLSSSDQLVILKKPFDTVEVLQLANALTEKWRLQQEVRLKLSQLEELVQERTKVLQETNTNLESEIAERKRAAEALRESEERYQLLFRKNPLPMLVIDKTTLGYLAVNETAVREYGYSVEEFLSMTVKDIRAPEGIPTLAHDMAEMRRSDSNFFTTRHRKKDGSIIDVELICRTITFAGHEAKLALASDVTQRKLAEDRIHQQAMLLDLAHDAIYVRDLDGNIQFWNKGAEGLYGWTASEAVGNSVEKLFSRADVTSFEAAKKALMEKGEWSGELHDRTKGGHEVIADSRWTLLRNESGTPRSILVINTDITEKKKLETQFLRSQRMEGIGTLATGMAHDLNNILAPILMSAGTLRWELSAEDRELAITRIEMSVKRGAEIIQQVLTFGRGVTGERVAVNPVAMMQEMTQIIGQTFPKDISIVLDAKEDAWPIMGDKTQIHQVLLNLCINARDAMVKGGKMTLTAHNIVVDEHYPVLHAPARPGSYVLLAVTDTGCGIPKANLERIFDPFFTTKEFGKGTGLGLSTVLGIVKSHQGLVAVDSELNQGTTFKILFPAKPDAAKNNALPLAFNGKSHMNGHDAAGDTMEMRRKDITKQD